LGCSPTAADLGERAGGCGSLRGTPRSTSERRSRVSKSRLSFVGGESGSLDGCCSVGLESVCGVGIGVGSGRTGVGDGWSCVVEGEAALEMGGGARLEPDEACGRPLDGCRNEVEEEVAVVAAAVVDGVGVVVMSGGEGPRLLMGDTERGGMPVVEVPPTVDGSGRCSTLLLLLLLLVLLVLLLLPVECGGSLPTTSMARSRCNRGEVEGDDDGEPEGLLLRAALCCSSCCCCSCSASVAGCAGPVGEVDEVDDDDDDSGWCVVSDEAEAWRRCVRLRGEPTGDDVGDVTGDVDGDGDAARRAAPPAPWCCCCCEWANS